MIYLLQSAAALGFALSGGPLTFTGANTRAVAPNMLYGKPREVQIIPSVLPADWANMGAECKRCARALTNRWALVCSPRMPSRPPMHR